MNDTIMVTGGTGFTGRHLFRKLMAKKKKAVALVRPSSNIQWLQSHHIPCLVHAGDTCALVDIFREIRPSLVIHLASDPLSEHKPSDISNLIGSNILFPTQIAEAMVGADCHDFLFAGTAWQHMSNTDPAPVNLYASTKSALETILAYYRAVHGFRLITLRLYDTFGPQDDRNKLVTLLRQTAQTGETLNMSLGEQKICPAYIEDVVNGFILASDRFATMPPGTADTFAVPGPELLTLRQFVTLFEKVAGTRLNIHWGGRPYRHREVFHPWQGTVLPGWQPETSLEDGLRRTLDLSEV